MQLRRVWNTHTHTHTHIAVAMTLSIWKRVGEDQKQAIIDACLNRCSQPGPSPCSTDYQEIDDKTLRFATFSASEQGIGCGFRLATVAIGQLVEQYREEELSSAKWLEDPRFLRGFKLLGRTLEEMWHFALEEVALPASRRNDCCTIALDRVGHCMIIMFQEFYATVLCTDKRIEVWNIIKRMDAAGSQTETEKLWAEYRSQVHCCMNIRINAEMGRYTRNGESFVRVDVEDFMQQAGGQQNSLKCWEVTHASTFECRCIRNSLEEGVVSRMVSSDTVMEMLVAKSLENI